MSCRKTVVKKLGKFLDEKGYSLKKFLGLRDSKIWILLSS